MVRPMTLREQRMATKFLPTKSFVIYFACVNFDRVWTKDKKGQVTPAMAELPAVTEDIRTMKKAMLAYEIVDTGPTVMKNGKEKGMYELDEDPKLHEIEEVKRHLIEYLRTHPEELVLIVYVIAGHGMQMSGKQVVLVNEHDERSGWYKFWGIES